MTDIGYWYDEYKKEMDELLAIVAALTASIEAAQSPKFAPADAKISRIRYNCYYYVQISIHNILQGCKKVLWS